MTKNYLCFSHKIIFTSHSDPLKNNHKEKIKSQINGEEVLAGNTRASKEQSATISTTHWDCEKHLQLLKTWLSCVIALIVFLSSC